jgi:hypothetical protein
MTEITNLCRPIIGIENRTAQEAFDIMADRIRAALSSRSAEAGKPVVKLTEEAIDAVVSGAEVEWSYHEDNDRYPRDFWHARISFLGYHDTWTPYGKQEQSNLPDDVKSDAEKSLRGELRAALQEAFAAPVADIEPVSVPGGWSIVDAMQAIRAARKFGLGDLVTKTKGSSWTGHVVGFYSTAMTPVGYAVESETEAGSVQIYPEAALAAAPHPTKPEAVDDDAVIERLTKALTKLEREASEVSKIGAKPGTQWTRLAGALINARSALAAQGEDAALKSGRSQP